MSGNFHFCSRGTCRPTRVDHLFEFCRILSLFRLHFEYENKNCEYTGRNTYNWRHMVNILSLASINILNLCLSHPLFLSFFLSFNSLSLSLSYSTAQPNTCSITRFQSFVSPLPSSKFFFFLTSLSSTSRRYDLFAMMYCMFIPIDLHNTAIGRTIVPSVSLLYVSPLFYSVLKCIDDAFAFYSFTYIAFENSVVIPFTPDQRDSRQALASLKFVDVTGLDSTILDIQFSCTNRSRRFTDSSPFVNNRSSKESPSEGQASMIDHQRSY